MELWSLQELTGGTWERFKTRSAYHLVALNQSIAVGGTGVLRCYCLANSCFSASAVIVFQASLAMPSSTRERQDVRALLHAQWPSANMEHATATSFLLPVVMSQARATRVSTLDKTFARAVASCCPSTPAHGVRHSDQATQSELGERFSFSLSRAVTVPYVFRPCEEKEDKKRIPLCRLLPTHN